MMIYVKNTYKPMRKSKKRVDQSKRPTKAKIIPVETHFNVVASGIVPRETPQYKSLDTHAGSTAKKPILSPLVYFFRLMMICGISPTSTIPVTFL